MKTYKGPPVGGVWRSPYSGKANKRSCTHHLRSINDPEYRYQCVKCDGKFKIASGIVLKELAAKP